MAFGLSTSPFLSLPRELRDQIYSHYFISPSSPFFGPVPLHEAENSRYIVTYNAMTNAPYENRTQCKMGSFPCWQETTFRNPKPVLSLLSLLLVNRQISNEVLAIIATTPSHISSYILNFSCCCNLLQFLATNGPGRYDTYNLEPRTSPIHANLTKLQFHWRGAGDIPAKAIIRLQQLPRLEYLRIIITKSVPVEEKTLSLENRRRIRRGRRTEIDWGDRVTRSEGFNELIIIIMGLKRVEVALFVEEGVDDRIREQEEEIGDFLRDLMLTEKLGDYGDDLELRVPYV